jgi:hypothetical protein
MKRRKPFKLPPEFRKRKSKRARKRVAKRSEQGLLGGFLFVQNKEPLKKRTSNPCPQ